MDDIKGRAQTLVRGGRGKSGKGAPADAEQAAEDRAATRAINLALVGLLTLGFLPAVTPIFSILAIRRSLPLLKSGAAGVRPAVAVTVAAAAAACNLVFWILWVTLRPTPAVLVRGWAGFKGLPAIPMGFQQTDRDPFAFTPGSWKAPDFRRR